MSQRSMSTNSDQILLKAKDIEVGFPIIEGFVQAVRGVSFDIIQGKTLALVGESGSGKSVTARALMGMLSERAVVGKKASVEFAGQQLIGLPEEQLQKIRGSAISMIFQEPMTSLNPLYTVGNQIIESIQAHRKMPKKEARAEALRLLQEVQIPKPEARLDQYPHQLSGGQRQRVMIALAIANEPKLLIADEPTTALDVTIQAQILRLIKDLQVKYGMSVLLITHDLNVVRKTSEQICVMRNGEIVERGLTEEVFTNPQHPYTQHLIRSEPKGSPPPLQGDPPSSLKGDQIRVVFKIRHGSFFNRKTEDLVAVNDVSIKVRQSESVGVVGESGSGKSVTAKAIMQLNPGNTKYNDDAEIILDNENVLRFTSKDDLKKIRGGKVSMIFQEPMASFAPAIKIGAQMVEQLLIHKDINKNEAKEISINMLQRVGIADAEKRFNQYAFELSGGMRQRAMIAMALSTMPKLLLADEPTTALDVTIQAQVINLVKDIIQEYQMGVIFITHDLGVIAQIADDVAVMYLGSVVEKGPVNKILKNPKHPYTKGLLEALPDVNNLDAPLRPIPGNIPSPLDRPSACVFRTRCPNPCDNCRNGNTEMGLIEVEPGHWVDQCCINCG